MSVRFILSTCIRYYSPLDSRKGLSLSSYRTRAKSTIYIYPSKTLHHPSYTTADEQGLDDIEATLGCPSIAQLATIVRVRHLAGNKGLVRCT